MTNREAIEIVEDIGFYVPLLDSQKEALNQLIQIAKFYEGIGEALHKVAESVGGHGGYVVSAEDIHTVLERE